MNHSEADYINAGYKYESAKSLDKARAAAQLIRAMLTSENPRDIEEARRLLDQGRAEARGKLHPIFEEALKPFRPPPPPPPP